MTNEPRAQADVPVKLGSATLPLADALALYKAREAEWRATLNEETYCEGSALWNAIQRADKIAKGIPVGRPITSPRLAAATARLEAELIGAAPSIARAA